MEDAVKRKYGIIISLIAIVPVFFLFIQTGKVEDNETSDFTEASSIEHHYDFFTNRNLNELNAVIYPNYSEMKADLTEEAPFTHKTTKKEFGGGRSESDGITWTAYFEK